MDKKEKISIILKILLVLVLVPIGVSFGWSNEKVFQEFTSTTQPNLDAYLAKNDPQLTGSYNYTYEGAKGGINGVWNQKYQLLFSSRIFCLRKGMTVGTGNYIIDSDRAVVSSVPSASANSKAWYEETIQKADSPVDINLTAVPKFNGSGKAEPTINNNMAYAISFYQTPEGDVTVDDSNSTEPVMNLNDDESAQKVIWAYNGDDESTYQDEALYIANNKYVAMEEMKKDPNKGDITNISLTKGETTDTTTFGSHAVENYILVGPFHISNHPYAEGKSSFSNGVDLVGNISEFSGHDLSEDADTLVGLIDSKVTIKSLDGTEKKLSFSDYNICYDNEGKIMYSTVEGADNSKIKHTDYTSDYANLEIPDSYKNNNVPFPDNDFYIKINSSKIEVGDKLTNVTLTARDTKADGTGCYITSTLDTTKYETKTEHNKEAKCSVCEETVDLNGCDCTDLNSSKHECKKYTCNYVGGKTNQPSDFIWKTVAVSSDGLDFVSDGKSNESYPYNYRMAMAVTNNSEIFKEMYNHIKSSNSSDWELPAVEKLIKKSNGEYDLTDEEIKNLKTTLQKPIACKKSNCNCKAYIFLGNAEGKSNIKHGSDYMLDVYIGEDFTYGDGTGTGFIKRYNPSDEKYTNQNTIAKSPETWYIDDENINDDENISHYHKPDCYNKKFTMPTNETEKNGKTRISCEHDMFSDFHKYQNKDWELKDEKTSHKHTTKCWKWDNGKLEHTRTYWYDKSLSHANQQPFLIVEKASTTVLKKELSLDLDVELKAGVTIQKYIDKVSGKNASGRTTSTTGADIEMKNGDAVGKANDCDYSAAIEEDRQSNNISPTCTYVKGSADRYQYKYEFISNPRVPDDKEERTVLQTEEWKKEHPAVIEAGDSITYKIVLKNNTNKKVKVTLEDKLPENIGPNSAGNLVSVTFNGAAAMLNIKNKTDETNSANIDKNPHLYMSNNTLNTCNLMGNKDSKDNNYYITLDGKSERIYTVTIYGISSAENSYDESNPVANTATITGVYRADVDSNDEHYLDSIANENNVSRDYYLCKKYNVSVNSAITDMFRTGSETTTGAQISTTEKVVDNKSYDFYDNKRLSINSSTRESNPLYMENGDCITYQIRLKDNATSSAPYYRPKQVKASVKVTKPTQTAEVVGDISSKDTTTGKSIGTITYNSTTEMLSDITIPAGREIIIGITFRINNNKTKTYDYNTLREVKASITKLTNTNGKTTTAEDGVAYCMMKGTCKDCRRSAFSGKSCSYCYKVNSMTEIMNGQISNGGAILNNVDKADAISSDYFRIKEYNIVVDKYISKVEHNPNRNNKSDPGTTFSAESRRIKIFSPKTSVDQSGAAQFSSYGGKGINTDPVYVEYGDVVTYKILVYNTTNDSKYNVLNQNAPYKSPQNVYVDVQDTLPNKYTDLKIDSNIHSQEPEKDNKNHTFKIINNNIPANSIGTITVSLVVNESTKETIETNTVTISNWKNINGYSVINNGARDTASDKYKLNDYNATLDEYISSYDANMEKYNIAKGFTSGSNGGITSGNETDNSYPNTTPLDLEKYEKYTIATKVTNTTNALIDESDSGRYSKYKTRVRPSEVTQTLEYGLKYSGFKATWYTADGNPKEFKDLTGATQSEGNVTPYLTCATIDDANNKNITYTYTLQDDNIILSPGEYIIYETTVEVTESNLCLKNLKSNSAIAKLTNINKSTSDERVVTRQNTANKTTDDNYVRLKDVVIAGNVWIDADKNGYKGNNESGKEVTVKLYNTAQTDPVATVTSKNGFYTFGRKDKATDKDSKGNYDTSKSKFIDYYVEFEYDGVKYKATDVYGGDSDGQANGMGNLNAKNTENNTEGGSKWRQGYSDLPGTTSGKTEYMTDSNAYEFDSRRNTFNSDYQTIGFNKAYTGFGNDIDSANDLNYDKKGHVSELIGNSSRKMTARSFITQDFSNEDGISESIDNTNTLFLQSYGGHSNEYPETEYLKFINLGLVPRDELDVSIEADVQSIKTTINGEEMTYEFGTNDADSTASNYNEKNQKNAYKLKDAYNLNLYTADYNYKNDQYYGSVGALKNYKGNESELNAEVTYKVKLHNKEISDDVPIRTAFNEIAIYYDANFMEINETTKSKTINVKVKDETTGMFIDKEIPKISVKYGGEELDSSSISLSSNYGNTVPKDLADKGYKALYIKGGDLNNAYIEENQEIDLEIKFVVDKDTARNLLIAESPEKEDSMGLEMIAEVSAYTTKYDENYNHKGLAGQYAGLVDIDSNPGNLNLNGIEKYDNYEDDKYKVGIRIEKLTNTRSISGFVWDDARSEVVGKDTNSDGTVDSEIQYLGNGVYTENDENNTKANTNQNITGENKDKDKTISGVKVSLVEVVQTADNKYYEYPAKNSNGDLIEAVTDENGQYTLSDYIPGYYKVRFDYGYNKDDKNNILYNGQDYKSTTYYNEYTDENGNNNALYYENSQGYATDNIGASSNFGYFDKVKSALSEANKSDAQDDEIRRLNVNSYSETMTTAQGKLFSETSVTKAKEVEKIEEEKKQDVKDYLATNDGKLTKNTQMYAESSIFYTNPEQVASGQKSISATQDGFDTIRLWNLQNLDFGLEYRPESSIVLDKNISTLELVTSDNKTLVKLCFKDDENGERVIDEKKSKGYENVQFLANKGKEEQGFVYINMDTDILEGCTIKVDYEIDAENQSEVDRINKNLDAIKFETGANNYGAGFKVYTTHASQDNEDIEYSYNANGTAAQLLASQYYDGYQFNTQTGKETFNYLTKLKKSYNSSDTTKISNAIEGNANNEITLTGQGYYGMYLGQTYYTGEIGNNDKVAELKVDNILDYIDNDFTFDLSKNSTKDRLWQATTSDELYNRRLLDFGKVNTEKETHNLIDQYGIRYDTENRSNLALSVDDNKLGQYWESEDKYNNRAGNVSLSRFLNTKNAVADEEPYKDDVNDKKGAQQYTGRINAVATKVLSADDVTQGKGLTYNNIAEVVQYTSLTGRRTTLPDENGNGGVIGNANVEDSWTGYLHSEDDTDATEIITISPPTGLVK